MTLTTYLTAVIFCVAAILYGPTIAGILLAVFCAAWVVVGFATYKGVQ